MKNPNKIMINELFDYQKYYGEYEENISPIKHKLRIVELQLDDRDTLSFQGRASLLYRDTLNNIDDLHLEFQKAIQDENYDISDSIEIYYNSYIKNNKIYITGYFHETSAECDVSFSEFSYDEKLKCWIIRDDFWGAPNGIDGNGIVTILDFSKYFL